MSETDHQTDRNWLTWLIIIVSVIVYLFHKEIESITGVEQFWFKGQAFFILLMSIQIMLLSKKKAVPFILFGYATSNLLDETVFSPVGISYNEIIFSIIIPVIAYYIYKKYDSKF